MVNRIIKGRDNNLIISFIFTGDFETAGLNNFNRITVDIGDESYSTDNSAVKIFSNTDLHINIGGVTTLDKGSYTLSIIGYNPTYPNGYLLNGDCKELLPKAEVC